MDRTYPKVTVSKKCEKFIKGGHIWVYFDEIKSIDGAYENGDIVDVLTEKGRYLGSGYINDNSKLFYNMGLKEWLTDGKKERLLDVFLSMQDDMKCILDYFEIEYDKSDTRARDLIQKHST